MKHARIQRGDRGPDPTEKSQNYRVSLQYWSGSPEKSQSYQASIPRSAIIGTPAKRHLNTVEDGHNQSDWGGGSTNFILHSRNQKVLSDEGRENPNNTIKRVITASKTPFEL